MRRFLPLLLLAACAGQAPAPTPTAWIGRSEVELVSALGVPSRVHEAEGRRFLAYDEAPAAAPAVVPSIGIGGFRSSGGWGSASGVGTGLGLSFGPFGTTGPCTTRFEVAEGRVVGAMRQGPGCG
jgi:hypothetical protein